MARALLVAYYFPPLGGMASLRALGHARHLPEHGWETDVLAPREGAYHRDPELSFPEQHVTRTGSLELSRLGKRVLRTGGDDSTPAQVAGSRDVLRRAARAALYFPDAQIGWAPFALRAGRRVLRERPVEAIVSTSFPITSHLVARRLAREAGVPWVAEFRDPWSEMLPTGRRREVAARLERSLARDATAVVMTSPSWAAHHAGLWGRHVDVVPNGHDVPRSLRQPRPDGVVLGYVGTFYPATQASLEPVWAALARLMSEGVRVEEIRIIGALHPAMRAELDAHGLGGVVRETGFLPHQAALEQLASCSLALLAGPADASGILEGQVAGKIWEYLATDLPVIYVGARASDPARLLDAFEGTHVVPPGDASAASSALTVALGHRHERDASALSRRARAGELAAILDRSAQRRR